MGTVQGQVIVELWYFSEIDFKFWLALDAFNCDMFSRCKIKCTRCVKNWNGMEDEGYERHRTGLTARARDGLNITSSYMTCFVIEDTCWSRQSAWWW